MQPVQLVAINCDALKLVTGPQAGHVAVREPAKGRVYGRNPRLILHNRRSCPRFPPPARIPIRVRAARAQRCVPCPSLRESGVPFSDARGQVQYGL